MCTLKSCDIMWWIVNNCNSHQECMSRALCDDWCFTIGQWATMKGHSIDSRLAQFHNQQRKTPNDPIRGPVWYMGMDQYLLIPFLVGWTSIYQLFWCSPGVQGFDTLPHELHVVFLRSAEVVLVPELWLVRWARAMARLHSHSDLQDWTYHHCSGCSRQWIYVPHVTVVMPKRSCG